MKTLDELAGHLARLILAGVTEVGLEFEGGLAVLRWRFPGQPAELMAIELEAACPLSGSSC